MRRLWVVAVAVVVVVVPAVALSALQNPVYEAEGRVLLRTTPAPSIFDSSTLSVLNPDRFVQNEIAVMQGAAVAEQVRTDLGLAAEPTPVTGTAIGTNDVIAVTVRSGDPVVAARLVNGYIDAYITTKRNQAVDSLVAAGTVLQSKVTDFQNKIEALDTAINASTTDDDSASVAQRSLLVGQQALFTQRIQQIQVDAALSGGGAQVVRPATEPIDPVEPTPVRTAALALVIGLLLGLAAALAVDHLDDAITSPDDLDRLETPPPVLAMVPVQARTDHGPVAVSNPTAPVVEAFRTLRTNVNFFGVERAVRVIEVTSSLAGEGKTTTASNLAVVLAQAGNEVVLVDADLRNPAVAALFGLTGRSGLTDALMGEALHTTFQEAIAHLTIITAGPPPPNPSEILSGDRLAKLFDELRTRFDYVIVDSAPVLPVSDSVALSRHVDGVLVVVECGRVSVGQLRQTLTSLSQVAAPVLGIVLNQVSGKAAGYGTAYEYRSRGSRTLRADLQLAERDAGID